MTPPNHSPYLDDAAALFFQIEISDKAALQRLVDLLSQASRDADLPPHGQEAVGRAVWSLFDVIEGISTDPDGGMAEIGRLIEQALLSRPDAAMVSPSDGFAPERESDAANDGLNTPDVSTECPSTQAHLAEPSATPEVKPNTSLEPIQLESPRVAVPMRSATITTHDPISGDPLVARSVDRSLLADFVAECAEYVSSAESGLLILESNQQDHEAINMVLRAFHTVKGSAGYIPIPALTRLAHHAESLFTRIRDGEIICAGEYADLALQSADMVREILAALVAARDAADARVPSGYDDVVAALIMSNDTHEVPHSREQAVSPAPVTDTSIVVQSKPFETSEVLTSSDLDTLAQLSNAIPKPTGDLPGGRRGSTDALESSIRIRTERLDRLIDMVGELVIAQAMVSQDDRLGNLPEDKLSRKVLQATKIVRDLQDLRECVQSGRGQYYGQVWTENSTPAI